MKTYLEVYYDVHYHKKVHTCEMTVVTKMNVL